ncbi:MAG: PaaI family thioesterase [Desulfovibrionales bacterium]|nr:MAG: PaaI family thioesterase [Desulfovibrionales bacterium]
MDPEDFQAFRELIETGIPFNRYLGVQLLDLGERQCRLLLPFRPELVGDGRRHALHGGVISALIDACGGFAVWSTGSIQDRVATIDLRVDYLQPAVACDIIAHARIRLLGNRVGNVSTVVYAADAPDTVIAEGRSVYNIRRI